MKKFLVILLLIVLVIAVSLSLDFYFKVSRPYQGYDTKVELKIGKGTSISAITGQLYQNRIIVSKKYFLIFYRLFHHHQTFQAGEYLFDKPLTMAQVIDKLHLGQVILSKITIKEGLTIGEISSYLTQEFNLSQDLFRRWARNVSLIKRLDNDANDLEGYLFPDTYLVSRSISANELVEMMVDKFKEKFNQQMIWRARDLNLSIRQIVTLASLIEKESSSREERFLISSVFHNRLRLSMGLDCDPTIVYALKKENRYTGRLTWDDLKFDSPYNTRLYRGLPPGPICNPGYDSLEAALYPAQTNYLYFVAKDEKYHHFSSTLKEHNQAVRKYILNKDDE